MTTDSGPQSGPNTPARRAASPVRAIFLVGFMGAGKTSVGKALGRQLGWAFEDLDDRLESREGRTVERIFRESGEAAFRQAETAALLDLLDGLGKSPRVVALGGGAFVQSANADLLAREDISCVFLDAPVEELFRRCQEQQVDRPLRGSLEQFHQLYESRRPHYMRAVVRVDTATRDVEAVASEVSRVLGILKQTRSRP